MYRHILIPTDGSELSKLALEEGVALAEALNARVTVVTVTTPFHVISGNPVMLTDTPERYKDHMATVAKQYLDKGRTIAAAAGVECDLVHVEHEHPYKAIIHTAQNRGCDAIQNGVPRTTRDISRIARERNAQGADTQHYPGDCRSSVALRSGLICLVVTATRAVYREALPHGLARVGFGHGRITEAITFGRR